MKQENKYNYKTFIEETGVDHLIDTLKQDLTNNGSSPMPQYSDMISVENNKTYQYVNYVQEGGGVLGVALIGYTYVLEKLGFRFLKLAGTSAGAINTILLAGTDKMNYKKSEHAFEYKSEIILQEMLDFNLWKLVDGSKFGKWLIKMFVSHPKRIGILKNILSFALATPFLFSIIAVFGRVLFGLWPAAGLIKVYDILVVISFIALIVLLTALGVIFYYGWRFKRAGFGINPGKEFYTWIEKILSKNKIKNIADLEAKMKAEISIAHLRPERSAQQIVGDNDHISPPYITLVTSDITNESKVEFPAMAADYYEHPEAVNPADFVRASMSIPIFFEPFKITVTQKVKDQSNFQQDRIIKRSYKNRETYQALFIDGGVLSNFPYNVFHNPKIKIARMPTFGVRLEDEDHIDQNKPIKSSILAFSGLLKKIFNTIRFNYDREFLKKNTVYEMCIGHVDMEKQNWLDFSIGYDKQKELFLKGVEAGIAFFKGGTVWIDGKSKQFDAFDWEKFKTEREKIV